MIRKPNISQTSHKGYFKEKISFDNRYNKKETFENIIKYLNRYRKGDKQNFYLKAEIKIKGAKGTHKYVKTSLYLEPDISVYMDALTEIIEEHGDSIEGSPDVLTGMKISLERTEKNEKKPKGKKSSKPKGKKKK